MSFSLPDMATADLNKEDRVCCALCLDPYSNPRCLPCGHTFCHQCLQSHITANIAVDHTFMCPLCNTRIPDQGKPTSSLAAQFPRIVALTQAVDQFKQLKLRELTSWCGKLCANTDNGFNNR